MRLLKSVIHRDIENLESVTQFTRLSTRAICIYEGEILLLFTKRYQDYSLPGGGLDENEDQIVGLQRELQEETGAKNIKNIKAFGRFEEYRPWYKSEYDVAHIVSYCYTCEIDKELGPTNYETYEIKNGMQAMWININKAIKENEITICSSPKKGLSIERELYLLRTIKDEFNL